MSIFSTADDGAGKVVAVGSVGVIYSSTDGGANWTPRTSGTSEDLNGIAYGNLFGLTRWVAVGNAGTILYSDDGFVWTAADGLISTDWNDVAFYGEFMAVGDSGRMAISTTMGVLWDLRDSSTVKDLYAVSVDATNYLIVGADDTVITGSLLSLDSAVFVEERVGAIESTDTNGTFSHSVFESAQAVSGYEWTHDRGGTITSGGEVQNIFVGDGVSTADTESGSTGIFGEEAAELFELLDGFFGNLVKPLWLAESMDVSTSIAVVRNQFATNSESMTLTLIEDILATLSILESVDVAATIATNGVFNHEVLQQMTAKDKIIISFLLSLVEGITTSDVLTGDTDKIISVVEKIRADTSLSSTLSAIESVAEALAILELIESGKGAEFSDIISVSEAIAHKSVMIAEELEGIVISALAGNILLMSSSAVESLDVYDVITPNQILQQALSEGVVFDLSFGLDGNVYTGWVMNTDNFALSEYQDYPFNSFAEINGKYYGANDNGIYLLDGDTDAGDNISSSFTTGSISFENTRSNIADSFIALRTDGTILLKTLTDDDVERWYKLDSSDWSLRDKRVKMARGVKSRYWQFTITNVDGSNFEIDELVLLPIILKRR